MTPRQARTQRREAERAHRANGCPLCAFNNEAAAKLARKAEKLVAREIGFVSQNPAAADAPGFVSQNAPSPVEKPTPVNDSNAERRREINRANAQHSTGPRTPEGRLASSRNSLKHGLASGELIIPGEDRAAFEALLNDLLEEHQPVNCTEELLIHEMAQAYWLGQRAIHFQNQCFTEEGVDEKRLALFLRYQTTHDRRFHKALNTLIKLKKDAAIGFVRQTTASAPAYRGFVSQNEAPAAAQCHFVPKDTVPNDPPAGFVSQNGA